MLQEPEVVVFDTETTGVDVWGDRIVTATVAVLDAEGDVIDGLGGSWLINPGVPIPEGAAAVHGITTEHAETHGMEPFDGIRAIVDTLTAVSGVPVVAFNANFDFTILAAETERHSIRFDLPEHIIDPLVIDRAMFKYRKGKRTLEVLTEQYGLPAFDAHDATADAIAAGRLALAQLRGTTLTLDRLMEMQPIWHQQQAESLEEWLRRTDSSVVVDRGWPTKDKAIQS